MKGLFFYFFKGIFLGTSFIVLCFVIASISHSAYALGLSKTHSVTPERHSGFFVPLNCMGSQSLHLNRTSVSATQTRLNSLYEGMTSQNKSFVANMWGGSMRPRVNPLTSFKSGEISQNSKLIGGINHA